MLYTKGKYKFYSKIKQNQTTILDFTDQSM